MVEPGKPNGLRRPLNRVTAKDFYGVPSPLVRVQADVKVPSWIWGRRWRWERLEKGTPAPGPSFPILCLG